MMSKCVQLSRMFQDQNARYQCSININDHKSSTNILTVANQKGINAFFLVRALMPFWLFWVSQTWNILTVANQKGINALFFVQP